MPFVSASHRSGSFGGSMAACPRTWIGLAAEGDRVSLGSSLTHRPVVACTQFTMQPPPFSPLMFIGWHSIGGQLAANRVRSRFSFDLGARRGKVVP